MITKLPITSVFCSHSPVADFRKTTDGGFYMAGSYKATVELNGLTLTNVSAVYSGAAVHIQNSKRINVKVVTGTENTLVDAASGSQKGCLYIKGHAEFKQYGTLNVVGNVYSLS